jgi:hypothetical protein
MIVVLLSTVQVQQFVLVFQKHGEDFPLIIVIIDFHRSDQSFAGSEIITIGAKSDPITNPGNKSELAVGRPRTFDESDLIAGHLFNSLFAMYEL